MRVEIKKSFASGKVLAPPSKSMAHRALICGALSDRSTIYNIADSEDIIATVNCLEKLGAYVERDGTTVRIGGLEPKKIKDGTEIFCNESGSTLRFLLPLCMLSGNNIKLAGSERLMQRPLNVYSDIAEKCGISFIKYQSSVSVCGKLESGSYEIPGNISSQFITGLLFALPFLDEDSILSVTGEFESASYIDMTLSVLSEFGIDIKKQGDVFYISGRQHYLSSEYTVEGDCSNAAFLHAFNLIGGNVDIIGLKEDTVQGDRVFFDMFRQMKNGVNEFNLSDCPDLGPIMFAMSAACGGNCLFIGTERLRIKESDRVFAMTEELKKFGVKTQVCENKVFIEKCCIAPPSNFLYSHNDHRIVMALTLLCSITGGTIDGASAINKSFPEFFDAVKSLGIGVDEKWD